MNGYNAEAAEFEIKRLQDSNAALRARVARLERFICHEGGLLNEWPRSCPFGTKLTDHIKSELNRHLKANP